MGWGVSWAGFRGHRIEHLKASDPGAGKLVLKMRLAAGVQVTSLVNRRVQNHGVRAVHSAVSSLLANGQFDG